MTGDYGQPIFVSELLKCTGALVSIRHIKICSIQKNHPITKVSGSGSPIPFVFWNKACVSVWKMTKGKNEKFIYKCDQPIIYFKLYPTDAHLCEGDWPVFGDVFSIFAREHSTITSIHLLRNLLRIQKTKSLRWVSSFFVNLKG